MPAAVVDVEVSEPHFLGRRRVRGTIRRLAERDAWTMAIDRLRETGHRQHLHQQRASSANPSGKVVHRQAGDRWRRAEREVSPRRPPRARMRCRRRTFTEPSAGPESHHSRQPGGRMILSAVSLGCVIVAPGMSPRAASPWSTPRFPRRLHPHPRGSGPRWHDEYPHGTLQFLPCRESPGSNPETSLSGARERRVDREQPNGGASAPHLRAPDSPCRAPPRSGCQVSTGRDGRWSALVIRCRLKYSCLLGVCGFRPVSGMRSTRRGRCGWSLALDDHGRRWSIDPRWGGHARVRRRGGGQTATRC